MPKLMSKTTFDKIVGMLKKSGFTFTEIGNCCGVSCSTVSLISRGKHYHQSDAAEQLRRQNKARRLVPKYLPTPEEIDAECERLLTERQRVDDGGCWMPPTYHERDLMGA